MKRVILVAFLGLFLLVLSAQTIENKTKIHEHQPIFLDLSGGISLPVGKNFTGLDRNNTSAGYADNGYFARVEVDWMGKTDFGMAIQYTLQHNPLKGAAKNIIPFGGLDSLGTGSWNNHYLLIGPVYMKSISKFVIEANLLGGIILSFSPVFDTWNLASKAKVSNHAFGFGCGIGIGVGYNISPKIALNVNVGYLCGFPQVKVSNRAELLTHDTTIAYNWVTHENDTTVNERNYTAVSENSFKKTVSAFNAGIGLIIKF